MQISLCFTKLLYLLLFLQWESLPGCPDTVQTFFDIVATCRTSRDPYAAFCPTFTLSANQIIQDPVGFCAQASIRVDGPTDPATGLPASFKTKTFTDGEQQDCQHIAMVGCFHSVYLIENLQVSFRSIMLVEVLEWRN